MDYRKLIKDYMKANHVTYADLAAALGTSRQNVWVMLNGKKNNDKYAVEEKSMRIETVQKICDALGLELGLFKK